MADSTVAIGADLTQLRRELTKIPNLSAEAAQKTLIQLEKVVQKAEKSVKQSARQMARSQKQASRQAGNALREFGDKAGDTDSLLKDLAGAVGLMSPEADRALSKLGDLAGGVEGVTKLNTRLGLSLTRVLAVLGPLALAAAAVAAAYKLHQVEEEKAAEEAATHKRILDQLVPLHRALEQVRLDLAVATGTMTKQEAALVKAREDAHRQLIDSTEDLRATLQARKADLRELEAASSSVKSVAVTLRRERGAADTQAKQSEKKEARLVQTIADLEAQLESARGATRKVVKAHKELGEALEEETRKQDALRRARQRASDLASAQETVISALLSGLSSEEQAVVSLLDEIAELNKIQERFPELTDRVSAALGVLEHELDLANKALGEAGFQARLKAAADEMDGEVLPAMAGMSKGARDLRDAIDGVVPPSALSEIEQLQLLLLQAETLMASTTGSTGDLEEAVARLKGRLAELNNEGEGVEGAPAFLAVIVEGSEGAVNALDRVRQAVEGVAGAVTGAIGLFDQLLQTIAGFGFSDLVDVARAGKVTRDVIGASGEVIGQETVGPGQVVEEMVAGAIEAIQVLVESAPEVARAFGAELGGLLDTALKSLDPLVDAALDLTRQVVDSLVARFEAAGDTLAVLVLKVMKVAIHQGAKLLDALVPALESVVSKVVVKLPSLLGPVLEKLPALLGQVFSAAGSVTRAVTSIVDDVVLMLIAAVPSILEAAGSGATGIAVALTETLIAELVPKLPQITTALTKLLVVDLPILAARMAFDAMQQIGQSVDRLLDRLFGRLRQVLGDFVTELRPGNQTTATFGDTPGPVRAGLRGLQARFAPGDTVIAAQDPAELVRQAQQAAGGSSSVLDIRDGHLAIERSLVRNVRAGGALARLLGGSTGRVRVYG